MTDLVQRLRQTTAKMASFCSAPMTLWQDHSTAALQAANRIEALERENTELRADVEILSGQLTAAIEDYNDARREALEEAAAYHDDQAGQHDAVDYESDFHVQMVRRHRNYAAAIRALSESSPTPLQEQNANSGKEGE